MSLLKLLITISLSLSLAIADPAPATPTATAPFATIIGRTGRLNPTVHEYLGIPYAYPPTGTRRFAPPTRLPNRKSPIAAKEFGLSCPVQPGAAPSTLPFNLTAPEGEDCLSINIWTKPGRDNAPVLVWIYGGGFIFGTSNSVLYDGTHFAANNEAVVVSLNYRTNVFGFPNSPAATTENLGILDQRLALEWIRDNIKAFGGNPNQMTLFGHSAGGASVEIHSYAWPRDPIVKSYIAQSGSTRLTALIGSGDNYYRWGNLTEKVGCATGTEKQKLACMQAVSWETIVEGMKVLDSCNSDMGNFGPRVDGKVIFSVEEYKRRAELGLFAKLPLLIGSTDAEIGPGGSLDPSCPLEVPDGLTPEQLAAIATALAFTCPAKEAARVRSLHRVPIWRYRYFGSFNLNSTPPFTLGAAHGSELPVLFGTALLLGNPPSRERQLIQYMQSAWTAFAKNPSTGLSSSPLKLPLYNPSSLNPTLIRLAYEQEVAPSTTYPIVYDYICPFVETIPISLRRRVDRMRRGVSVEMALQGMTAQEMEEVVRWAGKAAGSKLQQFGL